MNVLLLGGAGFIGSYLSCELLLHGWDVTILSRRELGNRINTEVAQKVNFIRGDFYDVDFLKQVIEEGQTVIHLIGPPNRQGLDVLEEGLRNVMQSVELLKLCAVRRVKRIVFISSGGTVYGNPRYLPIDENHPLNPVSPYGITKVTIENYIRYFFRACGLPFIILRIANPYGEHQQSRAATGVIRNWIGKILKDEPIEIWGDSSIVKDYVHIRDVVNAITMILNKQEISNETFNVGSGKGHSLKEILEIIAAEARRTPRITYKPARRIDVPSTILDISRVRDALDWSPEINLAQGVAGLICRLVN